MGKTFLSGIFSPKMGTMQVWEGLKLCTHKRGRNIKFSVSLCLYVSVSLSCIHMRTHIHTFYPILSSSFPSSLPLFLIPLLHPHSSPSWSLSHNFSISLSFYLSSPPIFFLSHFLSLSLSPSCSKERLSFFDSQVLFLTFS